MELRGAADSDVPVDESSIAVNENVRQASRGARCECLREIGRAEEGERSETRSEL